MQRTKGEKNVAKNILWMLAILLLFSITTTRENKVKKILRCVIFWDFFEKWNFYIEYFFENFIWDVSIIKVDNPWQSNEMTKWWLSQEHTGNEQNKRVQVLTAIVISTYFNAVFWKLIDINKNFITHRENDDDVNQLHVRIIKAFVTVIWYYLCWPQKLWKFFVFFSLGQLHHIWKTKEKS